MSWPPRHLIALDTAAHQELARLLGIREEPGWSGAFSRREYPDAMRNGTRVRKVVQEPEDTHPVGAQGTVLGSIQALPGLLRGVRRQPEDRRAHRRPSHRGGHMTIGPGKYDKELTRVKRMCGATSAALIVIEGARGEGFSVQATLGHMQHLPAALRTIADQIEADLKRLAS